MRDRHFRLITLGRLALVSPHGEDESLNRRRRKLALLAVLALAARPYPREVLLDMFWGDEDEARARHSLSDALSHLRRVLGRHAIATRSSELELGEELQLVVDATEMEDAVARGDTAAAVALYGGPFLDGVHVDHSPRFESWLSAARERYRRLFVRACEVHCLTLARARQWEACAALARRWLDEAPLSPDAAIYLLNALKAPGTREALHAAVGAHDALAARLTREYGAAPDARVVALAAELRRALAEPVPAPASPAPTAPAAPPTPAPTPAAPAPAPRRSSGTRARLRSPRWAITTGLVAALLAGATTLAATRGRDAADLRPSVAVASVAVTNGDSARAWLGEAMAQMLAVDLAQSPALRVVPPGRVRDALADARLGTEEALDEADALRVARAVGATWMVRGGITGTEGHWVLDVSVRDAQTGRLLQLFVADGADAPSVARKAAQRLVAAAGEHGPGPQLADEEASSVDAWQRYLSALQAEGAGRYTDAARILDGVIAGDSGFVGALVERMYLAQMRDERDVIARLTTAYHHSGERMTEWDRDRQRLWNAWHGGQHLRAEALGRELVARYPRDPRSWELLAAVLTTHGRFAEADTVLQRELALDPVAAHADAGPCVPCSALGSLSQLRLVAGNLGGAERAARRWVALQPDAAGAWYDLACALAAAGQFDPALAAARRAAVLAGANGDYRLDIGRILVMARRYRQADSVLASWRGTRDRRLQIASLDLRGMLERERGQYRAAIRTYRELATRFPEEREALLIAGHDLGALGDVAAARQAFESLVHSPALVPGFPLASFTGDAARAFAWDHALEADAIGTDADTTLLAALADSIVQVSANSYYARDWHLADHVRGLIAERAGRWAEAEEDFSRARWAGAGWTRTRVELARAQLQLGKPREAIATLRGAYAAMLDAMARYVPRAELDYEMATAFEAAGMRDSAAVYGGYVRRAWAGADVEQRSRLSALGARLLPGGADR